MFRFEEPAYLYLLLLLPFLAAFYLYSNYRRRRNIRRFGDPELLAQLMPDVSKYRPDVKFWLIFAAIGLFSVLLARPQFGSKQETVKRKGVEVIIALDISNSQPIADFQAGYSNRRGNQPGNPQFYSARRSGTCYHCHHGW